MQLEFVLPGPHLFSLTAAVLLLGSVVAPCQVPLMSTQLAAPVGSAGATLNGMAVPRGAATTAWFEWGTDTSYGSVTSVTNIGPTNRVIRLSAPLDGLAAGGVYHYRLVATNAFGASVGADAAFTTGMKLATWISSGFPFPAIASGLTNVVVQACAHGHSLVVTSDGRVLSWMVPSPLYYTDYGQTNVPAGLTDVITVAGGWVHSLALKRDGTVAAWGEYMSPLQPAYVPAGLSNVIAIAGGDSQSIALKADGTVRTWGSGAVTPPSTATNVVAIAAGSGHGLALRADGKVIAWYGSIPYVPPTPPITLSNVVAIAAEGWHNLALRSNGTVVAWGDNSHGQCAVPTNLSNVVAIAAGFNHSLALKSDGTLVAWGDPTYVTNVPPALTNVVTITSGDYHSMALTPCNLAPLASSRSVSGPMNGDLVLSLSCADPNGDPLTLRIVNLPTNGVLYQYTASGRGDAITAADTVLTDAGQVIFAPALNAFGVPYDSFAFVANDGQYDSTPGAYSLSTVPAPTIQTFGSASTNGPFTITFEGLSNATYSVRASTNLVNWTMLGSATQAPPGQFWFSDTGATNRPHRFYRVSSP